MRIVILILGLSFLATAQKPSGTVDLSAYRAKTTQPTWTQARFLFQLGRWPELGLLREEPQFKSLPEKRKTISGNKAVAGAPIHWLTVTTFKSRYFRSEYHLIYFSSTLSMLGALVPQTVFYAIDKTGDTRVSLGAEGPDFSPKWPPNLDRALAYVGHDYIGGYLNLNSAVDAATDAISLVCPERPVVFVQDIFDIYECSNTLADSLVWEQYVREDTVRTLLSSFRWFNTRQNVYLHNNYRSASYDSSDFAPFRDSVSAVRARPEPHGSILVTAFTWSPGTGVLRRWAVRFLINGGLQIDQAEIAGGLGFTGFWM